MTITDIDKQLIDNFLADLADNEWIIDDSYSPDMVEMPLFQLEQKLKNLVSQAKAEQREEILKKITPALDDFSAAANTMIEDGLFKKTGQEIHENIGYIKSCFMSDSIASEIRGQQ